MRLILLSHLISEQPPLVGLQDPITERNQGVTYPGHMIRADVRMWTQAWVSPRTVFFTAQETIFSILKSEFPVIVERAF